MDGYKLDGIVERVKFCREAAAVTRLHTMPHLNHYNNGNHTFNMLSMLKLLHLKPSLNLIWAIIEHDMPERLTGDIPAPSKWFGMVNKDRLNLTESDINVEVFGQDSTSLLTDNELGWLKGLDILELYLFCKDEISLGNTSIVIISNRIEKFVKRIRSSLPVEIVDFYYKAKRDEWKTLPDLGD